MRAGVFYLRSPERGWLRNRIMAATLDRKTVEDFYRAHRLTVISLCSRILKDAAEAEDACHMVFETLLRKGIDFRGDSRLTTYVYRVTTNECLGRLRKSKRRVELRETFGDDFPRRTEPLPFEQRELGQLILEHVNEDTRTMAYSYYIVGMSLEEIGRAFDISGTAVKKRLDKFVKRARKMLKRLEAA